MAFLQLDQAMELVKKAAAEMKAAESTRSHDEMAAADTAREEFEEKLEKLAALVKSAQEGTLGGRRRKSRKSRKVTRRR